MPSSKNVRRNIPTSPKREGNHEKTLKMEGVMTKNVAIFQSVPPSQVDQQFLIPMKARSHPNSTQKVKSTACFSDFFFFVSQIKLFLKLPFLIFTPISPF